MGIGKLLFLHNDSDNTTNTLRLSVCPYLVFVLKRCKLQEDAAAHDRDRELYYITNESR